MATAATTTRKTNATKRSTTAKKAAQTRAANQASTTRRRTAAARKAAATRAENSKTPVDRVQEYAEKAILVPVGAALIARDNVVSTVEDLRSSYSTTEKAQRELRRFERRGTTARNRVERQLKRTRTRAERQLRQRRNRVERVLNQSRTRQAKNVDLVAARVENVVQTGLTNGTQLAAEVQKRISSIA